MSCNPLQPWVCPQELVGGAASTAASQGWDVICQAFADAAALLFKAFGNAFTGIADVNLASSGIASPYGISLVIAFSVAALLVFGQVMRTAWTHDGSGLAQAISGVAKAFLAWLLTAAVATAALAAADTTTQYIVNASFGSQQALAGKLANLVNWSGGGSASGLSEAGTQTDASLSLLLVLAVVGIILVIVLWVEMLLRNAAIAVLIAMSPIAAAGQVSETTKAWWPRMVSATVQLIILKPIIALVFAVGFAMAGQSTGIPALLQGLLVLALAVFCWPVIARFFTFATIQAASSGLSAALGFATGVTAGRIGAGQQTSGVPPDMFSQAMEGRIMSGRGGASSAAGAGDSAGAGASGGAAGGAGAALAGIGVALRTAQRIGNAMAGRMEQTAAHAGMHGAYPYSTVAGNPRLGSVQRPSNSGGGQYPGSGQQAGNVQGPAAGSSFPDEPAAPGDYDLDPGPNDGGDEPGGSST
ncbi:MAG TPA: hypothetical protein VMU95_41685 [Trebonia sp.]|nr:hypothetical protein [Trebonia sp.]